MDLGSIHFVIFQFGRNIRQIRQIFQFFQSAGISEKLNCQITAKIMYFNLSKPTQYISVTRKSVMTLHWMFRVMQWLCTEEEEIETHNNFQNHKCGFFYWHLLFEALGDHFVDQGHKELINIDAKIKTPLIFVPQQNWWWLCANVFTENVTCT